MSQVAIPDAIYRRQGWPVMMVISGPSGAGKDAVIRRMQALGHDFYFVVTTTSRPRREGEVDGLDYHFVSEAEFHAMEERGELLERADVYQQNKGISRLEIQRGLASGKDVVMRLDVQGAATIRRMVPGVVTVFLIPESGVELRRRLAERRTESSEQFERRLKLACEEVRQAADFDYVVVNPRCGLDSAVASLQAILAAEKCRSKRTEIRL